MNPGTKSTMLKQGLIVLIIAIILALGSMWVNMVLKKTAYKDLPEEERTDPDYMIENFRFFRFLPDGTPRYEAIGKKLTHYPAEDAYKIENPVISHVCVPETGDLFYLLHQQGKSNLTTLAVL